MRAAVLVSTINPVLVYPIFRVELARQRQQNLVAAADRHWQSLDADSQGSRTPTRVSSGSATSPSRKEIESARCKHPQHRWRRDDMLIGRNHFAHRETGGVVVDLFWDCRRLENEFRVEVADRRAETRFVLHPVTGKAAIQAFYHPFATSGTPFDQEAWAA
jgi:hypothetical protein